LTSPDSRHEDASSARDANLGTGLSAPLSRRELREHEARERAAAEAAAAPLTRRELRELEREDAAARDRELAERAREIESLEVVSLDTHEFAMPLDLIGAPAEAAAIRTEPLVTPQDLAELAVAEPEPADAALEPVDAGPIADPSAVAERSELPEPSDLTEPSALADPSVEAEAAQGDDGPVIEAELIEPEPQPQPAAADASRRPRRAVAARAPRVPSRPLGRPRLGAVGRRTPAAGASDTPRPRKSWTKSVFSAVAMLFVGGMIAVTALPSGLAASAAPGQYGDTQNPPPSQELITANGAAAASIDRDGYNVTQMSQLISSGVSTASLPEGRELAQEIMDAFHSGQLIGSTPDHIPEIENIAEGKTVPNCGVDYRILQVIEIALRNFSEVGISDINRACTGQIEGAGTDSPHYADGGGFAVDFYRLNNQGLDGTDANTLKLISILDPYMPVGAHVGQSECRAAAGITLHLTNWTEFDDACTHMHVDVPLNGTPLLISDSALLPASPTAAGPPATVAPTASPTN
jgi:hypothetical protein